ncbi:MAG: cyclic nucleotide-binding domain-containing protein [Thiotrichales bacterium]|nr:MAG: cyclic nucleotide-binding domain-containing protein [Thiotrichales bacterium]
MANDSNDKISTNSPFGAELEADEIKALAGVISIRHLNEHDILIKEGTTDDALHVVINGRLAATRNTGGDEYVTLHTLHEGDMAGAMGFIDGTDHSATLRALCDTEVYTLERPAFESLLETHPALVYKVMRSIIRSVHSTLLRMNRQFVEMNNYIMKEHGRY